MKAKKLQGPVPALSGRRGDQPLELPADPLAGRRDPRPARRMRGGHQALRDHSARPRRDRRGMEERDRRPRRLRRRQRAWARRAPRWSTRCDFVQFTGSDRTAKKVLARAAETLTPVSAELGGKDPMIVLKSANVERAANAATWGAFSNVGQVCISVERLYVEEPVYDEFVAALHRRGQQPEPGHGRPRARQGHRRDDLPATDPDRRGPRRGRSAAPAPTSSPAASEARAPATGIRRP